MLSSIITPRRLAVITAWFFADAPSVFNIGKLKRRKNQAQT